MSQRTLWEEGTKPGRQVATLAAAASLLAVLVNVLVGGEITLVFDIAFVAICIGTALAVAPRDFFVAGVLPPLLMFGSFLILAMIRRDAIAERGDGLIQAVISGLAHHAGALIAGYGITLVILALRQMAAHKRLPAQARQRRRTDVHPHGAPEPGLAEPQRS